MHVTRAVLPVMRRQRSGHIITISSSAGLAGQEFCTAHSASKFGLEGWMESLRLEIAPFGVHATVVNPGFFRMELLTPQSTQYAESAIDDYADRRVAYVKAWTAQSGRQSGDPAKLAESLVTLASEDSPIRRFLPGAIETASQKVADLQADIELNRERFTSFDLDEG